MSRAYKALRKLEYKQGISLLGRKTAIHGSTVWVDCSVCWMSISPSLSFFRKTLGIIRIYLYSRNLLWRTYSTDSQH